MACGRSMPKRELIRIVRTPNGDVVIDATGKLSGRGAYICHSRACWERVLQQPRLLGRVLKTNIPPTTLEALAAYAKQLPAASPETGDKDMAVEKGRSDENQVAQEK